MWTKICGVKSLETVRKIIPLGPDALGINRYKGSSRYLNRARATEIASLIRNSTKKIDLTAVYVNSPVERLFQDYQLFKPDIVQLHGDESPDYLSQLDSLPVRVMKAFRVTDTWPETDLSDYNCWAYLLDSYDPSNYGGTGKVAPWEAIAAIKTDKPVVLAGGLTPENIQEAIRQVRPWGVDVCSGVETDGKKDPVKIVEFLKKIEMAGDKNGD